MLWMKVIGTGLIFAGCSFVGWQKGALLRKRIGFLQEMVHSLILFKSIAGTYRLPLEVIFERISLQTQKPVSDFYSCLAEHFKRKDQPESVVIWQETIQEKGDLFDQDDKEFFMRLGDFMGIQDVHAQSEAVEACIRQLSERTARLEKERPEREKVYRAVAWTIGGFLIILFI